MFSKLFFWAFIALVAVLGCSEINFESSIYKEDEKQPRNYFSSMANRRAMALFLLDTRNSKMAQRSTRGRDAKPSQHVIT